jgi:alkanesulfonate monooxygenase SsuD/methylene tetrahydromethanopterin reductase-like flavin-dependent oxidoreductase (luciferase family)
LPPPRSLLPPPVADFESRLSATERAVLDESRPGSFVGVPATVKAGLAEFLAMTAADELIVAAQIFDHGARVRSYEITARLREEM